MTNAASTMIGSESADADADACIKDDNKRTAASMVSSDEGSGDSSDDGGNLGSVDGSSAKKPKLMDCSNDESTVPNKEAIADDGQSAIEAMGDQVSDEDLSTATKETSKAESNQDRTKVDTLTSTSSKQDDKKKGDLFDLTKTFELLRDIKKAGDSIKGKDVVLLVGETGAGKTTTALHFAGVKFRCIDIDGLDHFEPIDVPASLADFKVSGSGMSVTKSIHAATVQLPDGESVIICDTPGFGDTKGTEMEIANGLGIIHALQQTRSIKVVVVLNARSMDSARYTPLRKNLRTVLAMMGPGQRDFSSFEYVFTRCEGKQAKKIHRQLAGFQRQVQENPQGMLGDDVDIKDVLDCMLSDMVQKTKPAAIAVDVEEPDEEENILQEIWNNSVRISDPSSVFQPSISKDASFKLDKQTSHMMDRLDGLLKKGDFKSAEGTLQQLESFVSALGLTQVKDALDQAKEKALAFVEQVEYKISAIIEHIVDEDCPTKFARLAGDLRKELDFYSSAKSIHDSCKSSAGTDSEEYGLYLVSITSKVFTSLQESIESIPRDPVSISSKGNILKETLLKMQSFARAFNGFFSDELLQGECDVLKDSVAALIKMVVDALHTDQEFTIEETKILSNHLLFAQYMQAFVEDAGIVLPNGAETKDKELAFVAEIKLTSNGTMTTLSDLTSQINDFGQWDDIEESTALLQNVASDDVDDCRKFILAMLQMPDFLNAIHGDDESLQSVGSVLTNFDEALNGWMNTAVKELTIGGQKIMDDSKETSMAQSLVEAITVLKHYGNGIAKWTAFEASWDTEDLLKGKGRLEQYMEEMADCDGPESLLYGPEELGEDFYDMLVLLRAHKVEHGTCNVNRKYNEKLERWTNSLRKEMKKRKQGLKSNLTDKQVRALKKLGFDFREMKEQNWWAKYEELKDYRAQHGHCKVPRKHKTLGKWVDHQRNALSAQKRGVQCTRKMTADREKALGGIGFVWDARR